MTDVALIGAGNMARAFARGWRSGEGGPGEIFICDGGSGRAAKVATETGAVAIEISGVPENAACLVLAVKPAALDSVASELEAFDGTLISLLAGTSLEQLSGAFPNANCYRVMPNVAVEKRRGVLCLASAPADQTLDTEIRGYLETLGYVVEIPESQFDIATAVMGCSPAYLALVAESLADAGVRGGLQGEVASRMVAETLAGTAALLEDRDSLSVRRAVTSPGGSTAAGLAALERGAVRAAFAEAVAASVAKMRGE